MQCDVDPANALCIEWLDLLANHGMATERAGAVVEQLVHCLQQACGGECIYIPMPQRIYPMDRIRVDVERGLSIRKICRTYHLDRRTLYRLLGTLDRPRTR